MAHDLTADPRARTTKSGGDCARIDMLEQRLACLADAGPAAINDRLNQLEREWSAGRVAKATLAVLILTGTALAVAVNWWWAILPAAAGLMLLEYLFTRTSWLTKVFREAGFRCGSEIEHEKFALKTLRGDFKHVPTVHDIEAQDDITRLEGEGGIVVEPDAAKVDPKVAVKEVIQATQG
jgi:hypothetical protein